MWRQRAFSWFEDYLQIAEKDRLTFHNAPEKKPEVFEKLCHTRWCWELLTFGQKSSRVFIQHHHRGIRILLGQHSVQLRLVIRFQISVRSPQGPWGLLQSSSSSGGVVAVAGRLVEAAEAAVVEVGNATINP